MLLFFLHLKISKLKKFSGQIFSRHCHNKSFHDIATTNLLTTLPQQINFNDIATTNLGGIFENRNFNALNLPFENVIIAITLKCCGMEDRTVVTYGGRETQKAIIQGYPQRKLYDYTRD